MNKILTIRKKSKKWDCLFEEFLIKSDELKNSLLFHFEDKKDIIDMVYLKIIETVSIKLYFNIELVSFPKTIRKIPQWQVITEDISDLKSFIKSWYQTLLVELLRDIRGLRPFWNEKCESLSNEIWLPQENDWENIKSNEICNFEMLTNNDLELKEPERQYKIITRARKIRFYPNQEQIKIIRGWGHTARYVYNKTVEDIKIHKLRANFFRLRNRRVNYKNRTTKEINKLINDWELKTPKDIRAGSVKSVVDAVKTNFTNLKRGNIKKFEMKYRKRKHDRSIVIPKSAIQFKRNGRNQNILKVYSTYLNSEIRVSNDKMFKIKHNCRIKFENGQWFFIVPIDVNLKTSFTESKVCALDPGCRKFNTVYSEDFVVKISMKKENTTKIYDKLDKMKSLRSKKIVSNNHATRRIRKQYVSMSNLVDDMHYKTVNLISKHFNKIFLPKFESQKLVQGSLAKTTKRDMMSWKHYQFQQRLKHKLEEYKNKKLIICTEEYTSKTCTSCGTIKDNLGGNENFNCDNCGLHIDRDINGARNILIKNTC